MIYPLLKILLDASHSEECDGWGMQYAWEMRKQFFLENVKKEDTTRYIEDDS
jgi:hypothetical protein